MKSLMRSLWWLGLLMWPAISLAGVPENSVLESPGGAFKVKFEMLAHKKFTEEETTQNIDNINHVQWRITFYLIGAKSLPVAQVKWNDVYGWTPQYGPVEPEKFFKWFLWSPQEDFVILPGEGWASAPGTSWRKAVALNPALGWKTADFHMDGLVWANDFIVIGSVADDCQYEVNMFNGNTGKTTSIKPARAPLGYRIKSRTGRAVLITSLLDNCSSQKDRDRFSPQCFSFSLDTLRVQNAVCPKN